MNNIINVQTIINNSVLLLRNFHLSFCIEIVVAYRNFSAICKCLAFNKSFTEINSLVGSNLVSVIDEIEVTVILYKLICKFSFSIKVEITLINTIKQSCNTISTTVIISKFSCSTIKLIHMINNACLHISILIEQICLSINFVRLTGICVY